MRRTPSEFQRKVIEFQRKLEELPYQWQYRLRVRRSYDQIAEQQCEYFGEEVVDYLANNKTEVIQKLNVDGRELYAFNSILGSVADQRMQELRTTRTVSHWNLEPCIIKTYAAQDVVPNQPAQPTTEVHPTDAVLVYTNYLGVAYGVDPRTHLNLVEMYQFDGREQNGLTFIGLTEKPHQTKDLEKLTTKWPGRFGYRLTAEVNPRGDSFSLNLSTLVASRWYDSHSLFRFLGSYQGSNTNQEIYLYGNNPKRHFQFIGSRDFIEIPQLQLDWGTKPSSA